MNQGEIRRLHVGTEESPPRGKIIANFVARCNGDATIVLDRCKQVLGLVLQPDTESLAAH